MAAALLAGTSRTRVDTGGVLLPRYSPVKAAEVFGVPASLYPGRVDLGLGRAGGPARDFPQRARAPRVLLGMDGAEPEAGERAQVPPVPPRMRLLGAGGRSAALAGEPGTDYAFAHFLDPRPARESLAACRTDFAERAGRPAPGGVLAVRVITAESEHRAEALAHSDG
ncbi:LLM class flavin-dependent oxidoreductase [Streptomyces flaveolus]|uniref:LLM class flavin-dependent oxidoreductase n=1 Tax=Streptomyces flaveolus TaxID=67297 RepID=UPI0033AD0791